MHLLQWSVIHMHLINVSVSSSCNSWTEAVLGWDFQKELTKWLQDFLFIFHLYEAAVPQPGVDLEDGLTREAVEGTLKQDAAGRPQETILEEKTDS